ncbi:class I SAM-dependent methyltransferase [Desulfovibrio psychrotolerans]|uniref:Methyltransferase domain-containing protein n=1 Tax=Desulfovibrio psychrotolerans TaxID=415242 RepID=A0A7J0BWM9_9BACT|nr:class I SAM-dependent methyltransferase [Desulfovibrio psychrotolerans]GFM38103.1 hypothetical protein DSM19430T_27870 [Desulfovibrio psychrotolerans]
MHKNHSQYSLRRRFFARFKNTFLQLPWLWSRIINDDSFQAQYSTKLRRLFMKVVWFWPRLIDAEQWRDAAIGNQRDPSHFVEMTPGATALVDAVTSTTPDMSAPILDLGCNSGRILNALREKGYSNLHGVDISQAAYEHMHKVFPELAQQVHYTVATFQKYLTEQPEKSIETIFSHGATVELVHPSFPLIKHLCRVSKTYVILYFYETEHSYPRFWEWEFNREGYYLCEARRPAGPNAPNSLLVFKRSDRE